MQQSRPYTSPYSRENSMPISQTRWELSASFFCCCLCWLVLFLLFIAMVICTSLCILFTTINQWFLRIFEFDSWNANVNRSAAFLLVNLKYMAGDWCNFDKNDSYKNMRALILNHDLSRSDKVVLYVFLFVITFFPHFSKYRHSYQQQAITTMFVFDWNKEENFEENFLFFLGQQESLITIINPGVFIIQRVKCNNCKDKSMKYEEKRTCWRWSICEMI